MNKTFPIFLLILLALGCADTSTSTKDPSGGRTSGSSADSQLGERQYYQKSLDGTAGFRTGLAGANQDELIIVHPHMGKPMAERILTGRDGQADRASDMASHGFKKIRFRSSDGTREWIFDLASGTFNQ